ncbi:MAG TPA: LysM peptidoglycan-binding domain-containing protein, partial [Thermodesulfobacterium geofontis]|nr:LysM peptidoglycan-binding domain-containing protein [Thermodesulfobacterium geofontis]
MKKFVSYILIAILLSFHFFIFNPLELLAVSSNKKASSKEYIYYRVRRGDTLGEIARRYGTTVSQLRKWNGIRGDRIYVGQRLIVGIR